MTPEKEWRRLNEKHFEQVLEAADDNRFNQSIERPAIHRTRYPEAFERAAPNNIGVGSQADLSDLKIRYD